MKWRCLVVGMLIVFMGFTGCFSSKPKGPPRLQTVPLTGIVLVDGKPTAGVMVECHPEAGSAPIKNALVAMTDDKGAFTLAMYEKGDGLPPGNYSLTFVWETFALGDADRKDKLGKQYADPKKSNTKVTVVENEPNDLGEIELFTKGTGK